MRIFDREPVAILGLVHAVLVLLVAFNVHLSVRQLGAIEAVAASTVAVVARSKVTPIKSPEDVTPPR